MDNTNKGDFEDALANTTVGTIISVKPLATRATAYFKDKEWENVLLPTFGLVFTAGRLQGIKEAKAGEAEHEDNIYRSDLKAV